MAKKFRRLTLLLGFIFFISLMGCKPVNKDLVENYEEYYNLVKEGIASYESQIVVDVKNYDPDIFNGDVINDILEDNVEFLGNFGDTRIMLDNYGIFVRVILEPKYYETKEVLENRDIEVNKKIDEIIKELITPEMKDYEKEKVIHDYIVNNCKYDERYFSGNMPRESYTAYGALIEEVAVCQGYAVAMDKLLKAAGIDTMIILGEAKDEETNKYISHSWNLVKFEDEYYHLDATWNDPIMEDGSDSLKYSYFNITDEQIKKTHKWNEEDYPKANKEDYSFDKLKLKEKDINNKDVIRVKDENEFFSKLTNNFLYEAESITYKIVNFNGNDKDLENYIQQAFTADSIAEQCTYMIEIDEIINAAYVSIKF